MTCLELRSWILACDAPGCDASAIGEGEDPWPEGWDSYFVEDAGLTARDAVRHACPEHASRGQAPRTRPTCQHDWFTVLPSVAGRECEQCRVGRRRHRFRLPRLSSAGGGPRAAQDR